MVAGTRLHARDDGRALLRADERWLQSALLVGLGTGSLAKFLYRHRPNCRITAVEINPQVEFIARQYFRLPDDPARLSVVIGDGADYMLAGRRRFDYILVDGFDPDARAGTLDTLPFYLACRARLTEHGLLGVNLLGRIKGFADSVKRLRSAFDESRCFPVRQRQHHRLRQRRRAACRDARRAAGADHAPQRQRPASTCGRRSAACS